MIIRLTRFGFRIIKANISFWFQSAAENIREHGANVEYFGEIWNDADQEAQRRVKDDSVLYINPFDHPKIWTGHASMITELKADLKDVKPSLVVCSVGGGGLLAGILEGLSNENWDDVPVLAMETYGAESLNAAMEKKVITNFWIINRRHYLKSIYTVHPPICHTPICQQNPICQHFFWKWKCDKSGKWGISENKMKNFFSDFQIQKEKIIPVLHFGSIFK